MKSNVSRRLIYVVGSITFAYFVITLALPSRSLGDGTTCADQDGSTLPATLPTDSGEFSKTLVAEFHFQSDSAYHELVLGRLNQAKRSCNECMRTAALLVPDGHWSTDDVNDMLTLIEDVQKLSPNQQVQFRQMLRSYRAAEISLSERKLKEGLQYGIEAKQCMELLGLDGRTEVHCSPQTWLRFQRLIAQWVTIKRKWTHLPHCWARNPSLGRHGTTRTFSLGPR